ncbi:unnamed protein product [Caenorhabditis auriculariae]|uniref:ATP-dependent DNA helicase n=1 Tax=Caenorhabditis auriculariae TaxID=2777116 RepID=A0A8S1HXV6_9PELO|nr:unnamed protein product [Caenorhabditis auriculariae]
MAHPVVPTEKQSQFTGTNRLRHPIAVVLFSGWKREENTNEDDEEASTNEPVTRVPERKVDPEIFEKNLGRMNQQQKEIFSSVIGAIHAQATKQNQANPLFQDEPKKPILNFVSGTAGTGKSFLINMLADQLTMSYTKTRTASTKPAVLLAAPTGLAALNIRGNTIHGLFRIEVQHGRMLDFKGTDFEDAGSSRELLRNVKLIIIDEVSMCSNIILTKLHLRLQQIKGNRELFGGVNILAFGDLLQLPPVMAKPVFEPLKPEIISEVFGSIAPPINLWRLFDYQELTANMRQKDDKKFGEVMARLRIDKLDEKDYDLLKTRLIRNLEKNESGPCSIEEAAEYYLRILENDPTAIALFSTNDEVSLFNTTILKQLGVKTFTVLAEDVEENSAMDEILDGQTAKDRIRKSRIYQKKEFSIVKKKKKATSTKPLMKEEDPTGRLCGGLAAKLTLAENARVMLRRNLDVEKAFFDGFDSETKIERVNAVFNVSRRKTSPFAVPLTVAYAATIHKSQEDEEEISKDHGSDSDENQPVMKKKLKTANVLLNCSKKRQNVALSEPSWLKHVVRTGDVKEAFDDIFEQLPRPSNGSFVSNVKLAKHAPNVALQEGFHSRILEQIEIRTQNDTIEEALKKWLEDTGRRFDCDASQNVQIKVDMHQDSKYLIVKLNGAGPNIAPELKKD